MQKITITLNLPEKVVTLDINLEAKDMNPGQIADKSYIKNALGVIKEQLSTFEGVDSYNGQVKVTSTLKENKTKSETINYDAARPAPLGNTTSSGLADPFKGTSWGINK